MPPDREFERELEELGAGIEYPPTPDLSRAVRRRLDVEEAETGTRGFWARLADPRWAAAAAAFLLIIAVPALSPTLRASIDQWLAAPRSASGGNEEAGGAGGAARNASPSSSLAESGEDVPESGGAVTASAAPEAGGSRPLGEGLGLGERITLREARSGPTELLLPATPDLGKPDEVYAPGTPKDDGVALVYGARRPALPPLESTEIGLVLTERPGGIGAAYVSAGTPEQAGLERVNVGDGRGYWVPSGRDLSSVVERTDGLRGNIVLWEQEGLALRMETSLPKEEAVRIAGSVR